MGDGCNEPVSGLRPERSRDSAASLPKRSTPQQPTSISHATLSGTSAAFVETTSQPTWVGSSAASRRVTSTAGTAGAPSSRTTPVSQKSARRSAPPSRPTPARVAANPTTTVEMTRRPTGIFADCRNRPEAGAAQHENGTGVNGRNERSCRRTRSRGRAAPRARTGRPCQVSSRLRRGRRPSAAIRRTAARRSSSRRTGGRRGRPSQPTGSPSRGGSR